MIFLCEYLKLQKTTSTEYRCTTSTEINNGREKFSECLTSDTRQLIFSYDISGGFIMIDRILNVDSGRFYGVRSSSVRRLKDAMYKFEEYFLDFINTTTIPTTDIKVHLNIETDESGHLIKDSRSQGRNVLDILSHFKVKITVLEPFSIKGHALVQLSGEDDNVDKLVECLELRKQLVWPS